MRILKILRYENEKLFHFEDLLVEEKILNVYVNGAILKSIFFSNENEFYLSLGALFVDGIITSKRQIKSFSTKENEFSVNYYFEVKESGNPKKTEIEKINAIDPNSLFLLMKETLSYSETFAKTGGTHIVSVGTSNKILAYFEDISRLSALLKIAGFLLEKEISTETILFTSGRINYNTVEIANKINSKIIVSQSAVSTLAVKSAEDFGITLVGFLRGNRFNIYTHPERIKI